MKQDIFDQVKETILKGIEKDGLQWFKPWKSANGGVDWRPINRVTGRAYNGVNIWLLSAAMREFGYEYNEWLTFKNVTDMKGRVIKGEKATDIYFWNIGYWNPTTKKTYTSHAAAVAAGENPADIKQYFSLKLYKVFNIGQCEGIEPRNKAAEVVPAEEFNPVAEAERIIAEWVTKPVVKHGGNSAYYSPQQDYVQMPKGEQFVDADSYYKTLFHELVHSTGHETRLKRKGVVDFDRFGSEQYAMEELVAESGSMMLSGIAGLNPKDGEVNSVAYIKNWCKTIRETPSKAIMSAMTQSSKAVELIVGEAK